FRIRQGERVLCFYGPLLYEAKCVKVSIKENQVKYFIHYSGWNKNWDEWVPDSRVLKYVETNLQKQKELHKANPEQYAEGKMRGAAPKKARVLQQKHVEVRTKKNQQKTPGAGEGSSTSDAPQPPRKKRAHVDTSVENEETFLNRVEVKVKIPEELKPWLVDDWDLITSERQWPGPRDWSRLIGPQHLTLSPGPDARATEGAILAARASMGDNGGFWVRRGEEPEGVAFPDIGDIKRGERPSVAWTGHMATGEYCDAAGILWEEWRAALAWPGPELVRGPLAATGVQPGECGLSRAGCSPISMK
ncbi:hypothetical protein NDU88_005638, partial [Pleurodeles waltl]